MVRQFLLEARVLGAVLWALVSGNTKPFARAVTRLGENTPVPTAPLPRVRQNCAFCGRERIPKDDNHAPGCPYWDFFGP